MWVAFRGTLHHILPQNHRLLDTLPVEVPMDLFIYGISTKKIRSNHLKGMHSVSPPQPFIRVVDI